MVWVRSKCLGIKCVAGFGGAIACSAQLRHAVNRRMRTPEVATDRVLRRSRTGSALRGRVVSAPTVQLLLAVTNILSC